MFEGPESNDIEDWVCIMEAGTEYEIELAKNYLTDLDIPANVFSKRDSALSLNVGETAMVYLYVPRDFEDEARQALADTDIDDDFDNEED